VDDNIASVHSRAWYEHNSPEPHVLRGWPEVDLDRQPPGHSWILTACIDHDILTAYLVPIRLDRQVGAELRDKKRSSERLRKEIWHQVKTNRILAAADSNAV